MPNILFPLTLSLLIAWRLYLAGMQLAIFNIYSALRLYFTLEKLPFLRSPLSLARLSRRLSQKPA